MDHPQARCQYLLRPNWITAWLWQKIHFLKGTPSFFTAVHSYLTRRILAALSDCQSALNPTETEEKPLMDDAALPSFILPNLLREHGCQNFEKKKVQQHKKSLWARHFHLLFKGERQVDRTACDDGDDDGEKTKQKNNKPQYKPGISLLIFPTYSKINICHRKGKKNVDTFSRTTKLFVVNVLDDGRQGVPSISNMYGLSNFVVLVRNHYTQ